MEITKETIIGDVLDAYPDTAPLFRNWYALPWMPGFKGRINC